jgi:L-asparaginase II
MGATMAPMTFAPLIELTRGGTPESLHFGAVAVVDARGVLRAAVGDPHTRVFTRSTLKALQALPFVRGGGPSQFGFSTQQLALLCASHSGEPMHVEQVQGMLDKSGVGYRQLQCGCHVPMYVELGVGAAPAGVDERHHNCSGKHAGFVAYCVQHGLPLDSYLDAAHPLQQAIRSDVARVAGLSQEDLRMGIDGCSAPNYAMPLSALARSYARLASGGHDTEFGDCFGPLADAMTAHPELVSGTRRNDEAFMRAGRGDWVTKVGADGVQVVGSKSRQEALAIKVSDGNMPALYAATVEVLDQLGWLDDDQREALAPWRAAELRSVRGAVVGGRRAVLALTAAA